MDASEVKQRVKRIENETIWVQKNFYAASTFNLDMESLLRRAIETIEREINELKKAIK